MRILNVLILRWITWRTSWILIVWRWRSFGNKILEVDFVIVFVMVGFLDFYLGVVEIVRILICNHHTLLRSLRLVIVIIRLLSGWRMIWFRRRSWVCDGRRWRGGCIRWDFVIPNGWTEPRISVGIDCWFLILVAVCIILATTLVVSSFGVKWLDDVLNTSRVLWMLYPWDLNAGVFGWRSHNWRFVSWSGWRIDINCVFGQSWIELRRITTNIGCRVTLTEYVWRVVTWRSPWRGWRKSIECVGEFVIKRTLNSVSVIRKSPAIR